MVLVNLQNIKTLVITQLITEDVKAICVDIKDHCLKNIKVICFVDVHFLIGEHFTVYKVFLRSTYESILRFV
jgi:hypothetical protein